MNTAVSALALVFALCGTASAADKHGGLEVEAGKYHVELVVKDRDLSVHVRDRADKPISPASVKATANVLSGKDRSAVQLMPAAGGLRGQAPFAIAKDAKIVVTFSVGEGKKEQARFSLGARQDHKGHKH